MGHLIPARVRTNVRASPGLSKLRGEAYSKRSQSMRDTTTVWRMSETAFPLTVTPNSNGLIVSGEIDGSTVDLLSGSLNTLPGQERDLMIDMANVMFIDSSGLRVLIQAHQKAEQTKRRLVIVNPSLIVSRLFDVSGLNDVFTVSRTD